MEEFQTLMAQFGVSWPKLLAQIILFLILYFALSKFAFGPILRMLEERRRRIEEAQSDAEKIKQQLAEAEKSYQETLAKANIEAQGLIEEARKSADALSQRQAQEAIKQAEGIIAKARVDIENERRQTMDTVKKEMVGLVVDTTVKVTGKVLTPEDQERLRQSAVEQLAT